MRQPTPELLGLQRSRAWGARSGLPFVPIRHKFYGKVSRGVRIDFHVSRASPFDKLRAGSGAPGIFP